MSARQPRGGKTPPSFKSLVRVSPTQHIREQLLEVIENGDFAPGEALPSERALCEAFDVSRVSVREAIAGLEAMGVVTVKHGRGCFVNENGYAGPFATWLENHRDKMVDLLKVRGALDELAAYEAAQRRDQETMAKLAEVHEAFAKAVDSPSQDIAHVIELDVMFHDAVAKAAGSELLGQLLAELSGHIADSRRLTFASAGQPSRSLTQHQQILEAIQAGDAKAAKQAASAHVAEVRESVGSQGDEAESPLKRADVTPAS